MIAALLLQVVIAMAPTAAPSQHACAPRAQCPSAAHAKQSAKPATEDCNGVHCGPLSEKAPASDARYGGENLEASHVQSGFDAQARRYGSSGVDRNFDSAHVTSGYDRTGYDNSGTWPSH
jgi:hypothetical protein